jgi:BirA family biotin operon repressor/biotin-[acetyl-CoA-carboxylase] ligase
LAHTLVASVEHHATLGSTNDRAKVLAREGGADLPALVLADEQSAGRGRGANRWWTGPGSLAFSLVVDTQSWNVPRERLAMIALAAGIAVVEAVSPRLSRHRAGLHWPNDVYVGQRKLAGVLVEVPAEGRLVVGVGVNTNCRLADAPGELADRVAALIDLSGRVQDHTSLLVDWLTAWADWAGRLPTEPERIGGRADELCLQRGRLVRVRQGAESYEGRCEGIALDGAFRLKTQEGVREFRSGTIE